MPRILGRAALSAQREASETIELAETEEQVEEATQAAEALDKTQNLDPADFEEPGDKPVKTEQEDSLKCSECDYIAPDQETLEKHEAKHKEG